MADGQVGSRSASSFPSGPATGSSAWPPVTKLFSAFRIALDLKKMALAAAGIFATWMGWWFLCWLFYTPVMPQWKAYDGDSSYGDAKEDQWKAFRRDRERWNFLYRLAGPPTRDPKKAIAVDAADKARSLEQFQTLSAVVTGRMRVEIDADAKTLTFDGKTFAIEPAAEGDLDALKKTSHPLIDVIVQGEKDKEVVLIAGKTIKLVEIEKFRGLRGDVKPASALSPADREIFDRWLAEPVYKPAGKFRVCPWNEDRGPNPYLLTMSVLEGKAFDRQRGFFGWLLHDQLPVLAEPLIKFVSPVFYLFQHDAGGARNWFFLVFIILWNLLVWGFFGGVICRLAAVEFARNEKIPMGEAIAFVRQRYAHFAAAPALPLVSLLLLTIGLGAFGFITGWTHFFGDVVLAGLLWPIVLVIGLVMGVLLVGLFAWPLMYPTIAAEGSDSFDALSRPYSYLYGKPWHFIGYSLTALMYGAAVVFFVGFMGSLMVYLGQWGFNKAPWLASKDPTKDRTAAYFFLHTPTSFGWRDLFLYDSEWKTAAPLQAEGVGTAPVEFALTNEYQEGISLNNRIGAWLVSFWIGLTFLLVLGFGYSYFWTASTILYFLMRKLVDDTDFDEIHLDEEDVPPPPPMKEPPPAPPAPKPGVVSLNVVDAPK